MGPSQCHPLLNISDLPTPHQTFSEEAVHLVLTNTGSRSHTLDSKQAPTWLCSLGKAFPSPSLTFLTLKAGR